MRARAIPTLLLANGGLVKTIRFKDGKYIGDPINTVRLFNDMEVDELIVLDIMASRHGCAPNLALIRNFASECFMPFAYGGGVTTLAQMGDLFSLGVEKVALNHALFSEPTLLGAAASRFGNQAIVAVLNVSRDILGRYRAYDHVRRKVLSISALDQAKRFEAEGAGELLIYDVNRDGAMEGYDLNLVTEICGAVGIPVVVAGGAASTADLGAVVAAGASAAAAGSMFVYQSRKRGVLINYPSQTELDQALVPSFNHKPTGSGMP